MRKLLLASTVLAAIAAGPALAADMPLKAPPPVAAPSGSGWYAGIFTEADVAQSKVSGNNLFASSLVTGDLTATGGSIGGAFGYMGYTASYWYRLQATGAWSNISGTNSVASTATTSASSASVASRWAATFEADVGIEFLQALYSRLPTLPAISFPTFAPITPPNTLGVPRQYVGGGLKVAGLSGNFGNANGQSVGLYPFISSGFIWQTVNSAGKSDGGSLDASAGVAFPVKGFQFNNVFATNGLPITTNAGINLGTQYWTRLTYNFRVGQ
jgi:hypothetical protein